MSADAIRGYIKALRKIRKVTQPVLAKAISMPLPTYKDWERGVTTDIKAPYLVRALIFLHGSVDQIASFSEESTNEDGANLAEEWVSREKVVEALKPDAIETPQERARLDRLIDLMASGTDPIDAARIVQREG